MRTYHTQHLHYCGVDLHARSLFVNVLDHTGQTRLERDLPANPAAFLEAIQPYRDGLVVGWSPLGGRAIVLSSRSGGTERFLGRHRRR